MNLEKPPTLLQDQLPDLLAVYVFGSQMTGDAGAESDLDVAVLSSGLVEPLALWRLSGELADIVGVPVDLLDLRAASTVMQYQVLTTGRRLWSKDSQAGLFESFILSEKTALDTARAGLLADIQKDGKVYGR
ncbi:type VII toxin-antitoxin system MntA family adenylyltransferase antitoxin [Pseudomonas sp. B21-053]|uniref:type VII toxin-antitoxin system MntA family adenylyltransferase antitoxin n=1 Tax=Pseudomonas sp. B21-053 TaxID=2895493 RepID=UPI00223008EB|nr:nucleotidyltransferase domain-containing protein [Pseudomonas sp. B21-053]UZE13419.1 nucleotidyltransferase domain-containing protein [Pseudomonas sp. B21-053]